MFTARYGLIPYMEQIAFRLLKVNHGIASLLVCLSVNLSSFGNQVEILGGYDSSTIICSNKRHLYAHNWIVT